MFGSDWTCFVFPKPFGVNNQGAGFMTCSQKVLLNAHKILVGKRGAKRQLHRPRFRWKNTFCVKERDCECIGLHSVGSEGYGPTAGCCRHGDERLA